ncbi:hypothetical protein FHR72_005260 [Mycolicibacterium iranicum]|uniref:Ferredoxin n=1 Tax=Mycolicibacterium iranicum TaxID=912594 RepID=A0A839QC92_MYCIR|nr:hypothetical protein [Mycolicibacterium iranicum]MBB2993749.1 hypothetical protein [Mycolicibacterium iranicum]
MSVRPDDRLRDAPMTPVVCGSCGAQVLARKSSWEQTSVQWDAESVARCARRRDAPRDRHALVSARDARFALCPDLRQSIEAGVRQGALRVLDGESVL